MDPLQDNFNHHGFTLIHKSDGQYLCKKALQKHKLKEMQYAPNHDKLKDIRKKFKERYKINS